MLSPTPYGKLEHVEMMVPVIRFYHLMKDVEQRKKLSRKAYISESLNALHHLRDNGPVLKKEFKSILEDQKVNIKIVGNLLIKHQLAKPDYDGYWKLID